MKIFYKIMKWRFMYLNKRHSKITAKISDLTEVYYSTKRNDSLDSLTKAEYQDSLCNIIQGLGKKNTRIHDKTMRIMNKCEEHSDQVNERLQLQIIVGTLYEKGIIS